MIKLTSKLTRFALVAIGVLCLGSTVMAGPGPMYMMLHGKMMMVMPMTKDVMCKNGCKIGMNGMVTMEKGKTMKLKEGDMISSEGVMTPGANKAHGGG